MSHFKNLIPAYNYCLRGHVTWLELAWIWGYCEFIIMWCDVCVWSLVWGLEVMVKYTYTMHTLDAHNIYIYIHIHSSKHTIHNNNVITNYSTNYFPSTIFSFLGANIQFLSNKANLGIPKCITWVGISIVILIFS